jgi:hypothetical protein
MPRSGRSRPTMPLSGRDAPPCRRYRRSPSAVPPTLTRPHVGPRSVPADVLIRRPDLLRHAPWAAQRSVVTRPMYETSIALLTVVRSGQAGGIKGAEASLMDETLATVSPFALVRRGGGWWSCGDSNPGPSHCEGVPGPIGHRTMRCMSCEVTARVPWCRPRGAPGARQLIPSLRPALKGPSGCSPAFRPTSSRRDDTSMT